MDELPLLNVLYSLMAERKGQPTKYVEPISVPRERFINPSGEGSLEDAIVIETRAMIADFVLIHRCIRAETDGSFYEQLTSAPPSAFGEFYLYDDRLWHYPVGSMYAFGSLTITRNPKSLRLLVENAIYNMAHSRHGHRVSD